MVFQGQINKRFNRGFLAQLAQFEAALTRPRVQFFVDSLTVVGSFAASSQRFFTASLSWSASLGKTFGRVMTASISFTGNMATGFSTEFWTALDFSADLVGGIFKTRSFTAATSLFSALLNKTTYKSLRASTSNFVTDFFRIFTSRVLGEGDSSGSHFTVVVPPGMVVNRATDSLLKIGARVLHPKHGEGVIISRFPPSLEDFYGSAMVEFTTGRYRVGIDNLYISPVQPDDDMRSRYDVAQ